jgi:hypothetical protein
MKWIKILKAAAKEAAPAGRYAWEFAKWVISGEGMTAIKRIIDLLEQIRKHAPSRPHKVEEPKTLDDALREQITRLGHNFAEMDLKRHGGVRGKCMSAQQAEKHGRSLLKPILGDLSRDLFKEAVNLYAAAYITTVHRYQPPA